MHVPSHMLSGPVCPVTFAVAGIGVAAALVLVAKKYKKLSPLKFALVSALIFGLQMLNYPIHDGVSGHMIGGILAATCLGVPAAILSISLVLAIQQFCFNDGGILSANIVNMAIVGAGLGGLIEHYLMSRINDKAAILISTVCAVMLATAALNIELYSCGKADVALMLLLFKEHFLISLVEAGITLVLALAISYKKEKNEGRTFAAVVASLILVPLASEFPDALESHMASFYETPGNNSILLSDYAIEGISNELLSGILAAVIGLVLTFAAGYALMACKKFLPARNEE